MEGWIKLHRKALESSVFQDEIIWQVWCWCLIKASHEQNKFPFNGKDFTLEPGQFITGREKAVAELNPKRKKGRMTAQKWRTAMEYLKSTSRITIETNSKFSLITIIKWNEYQKSTSVLTNEQPASNQPVTTYKNVKNDKNEKNIYSDENFSDEAMERKRIQLDEIRKNFVKPL